MLVRLSHPVNALASDKVHTVSNSVPMYSVVNALQPWNAISPMLVATGNDILVNFWHPMNA